MVNDQDTVLSSQNIADRLFRGGYLFIPNEDITKTASASFKNILTRFEKVSFRHYTAFIFKDTPFFTHETHGVFFLVIGDIFDNDGDDVQSRLEHVASGGIINKIGRIDFGGRHVIFAITSDQFLVFSDPFGSRAIHYFTDSRVSVSSHAALLAGYYGVPKDSDVLKFMDMPQYQHRIVRYLPGDITTYKNILRLSPNHIYSSQQHATKRFWPVIPRETESSDALYDHLDRVLAQLRSYISSRFTPIISVTGGIDTRTIIGSFYKARQAYTGITWVDFNFSRQERYIIQEIVKLAQVDYHAIAVNEGETDKEMVSVYAGIEASANFNSGNINTRAPRAILMHKFKEKILEKSFENNKRPPVFIIGYGGEIIRGFYQKNSRDPERAFTSNTMLGLYGVVSRHVGSNREYSGWVARTFRDFFNRNDFSRQSLMGFDPNDLFYWEHRMGMWGSATLETIDVAMHCLVGLNSRRVYESALCLPDSQRLSKDVLIRYLKSRVPELGAIPVH